MSKPHRVGGPKSLIESFYCSDKHPDHPHNMRLNGPHSGRTRDEREDGLASQSGSHDEEVQDSLEGVRSDLPNSSNSVRAQHSTPPTSQTPERDEHNENCETDAGQRLEETNAGQVMKRPNNYNPFRVPNFAQNINIDIAPSGRSQISVPVNTITRPESRSEVITGRYSSLFQQGGAADGSLFSRGIQNRTPKPGLTSPQTLSLEDTQGTRNSTQPSDNFSQPANFEHPTPPTQESPEDPVSQMDTSDPNYRVGSNDV